jgi:hypothetical protein
LISVSPGYGIGLHKQEAFMLREWMLAAAILTLPTYALAQVQSGEPRSGVQSGEPRSGVQSGEPRSGMQSGGSRAGAQGGVGGVGGSPPASLQVPGSPPPARGAGG